MHNFSPLDEINKETVAGLKPAWRVPLRNGDGNPSLLVHQGVMYLLSYPDTVLAMDATNGDVLWRYQSKGDFRSTQKMGLALHGDKVFVPVSGLHVIALDAKTGALIWDHEIAHKHEGLQLRGAPLVAGGNVLQGTMGFYIPEGGFIVAIDIETGEESWRFNTVARPGEPGGNTWNDIPLEERTGGSVWHQGSYDPELNLAYFGTAPTYDTKPLVASVDKEGVNNHALFTNATIALNPDTGKLVWYYQNLANDQWDMDWVFERQIVRLEIEGKTRKVVFNAGKLGIIDALDAATGEYLFAMDMGLQKSVTSIDPDTGEKTINPLALPSETESHLLWPNIFGARSWPPLAYDPHKRRVYLPLTQGSMLYGPMRPGRSLLTSGVRLQSRPHPEHNGHWGRLQAVDLEDRTFAWHVGRQTPLISGMMATAGGLVFSGDLSRSILAYDADNGETLWETKVDDNPSTTIITYAVDGKQYIAFVVGLIGSHVEDWERLYTRSAPGLGMPVNDSPKGGAAIWAFALTADSSRAFVQDWQVADLLDDLDQLDASRSLTRGAELFTAASCNQCHKVGEVGAVNGPDLTGIADRLDPAALLSEIITPSDTITEDYRMWRVDLIDGAILSGMITAQNDESLRIVENPLVDAEGYEINRDEVSEMTPSTISSMPAGLLNSFTRDEILDLLAYIRAGGTTAE
jgi:alcohol dehydrogenase (cytochrome c)